METNGRTAYTRINLDSVEDSAPRFGFGEIGEARFANRALEVEQTGLTFLRLRAGRRQVFGHRHRAAEEVFVVIAGSGRVRLDDEIVELKTLDAIRVAPSVTRCFEAADEQFELLALGARHEGDGEVVEGFWQD